jgi:hypothetical protein
MRRSQIKEGQKWSQPEPKAHNHHVRCSKQVARGPSVITPQESKNLREALRTKGTECERHLIVILILK